MATEQIIVRIASDGSIQAETMGIKGPKCLDSIEVLEDLLEAQTTSSSFTPEYNETRVAGDAEADNELYH